jgi:hypothetical protein
MSDEALNTQSWQDKTEDLIGLPSDLSQLPTLRYQALQGRVFTLQVWPDGSTVRGEVEVTHLEGLAGGGIKEGWYDALGNFLGAEAGLPTPE